MSLSGHFVDLLGVERDWVEQVFVHADLLRARRDEPDPPRPLRGKTAALLFDARSTRAPGSFAVAMNELGGDAVDVSLAAATDPGRAPSRRLAQALSGRCDLIVIRTPHHGVVRELAAHSSVPVINALSDFSHPCQVLSDLYTLRRAGRDLDAMTVAWVGDGNHALHSWIEAVALFGFELRFAVPDGLEPDAGLFLEAERRARGTVRRVRDPLEAALGADVLCTDAWVRIGRESRVALRRATRASYRIDERLVAIAKPDAVLMHGFSAPPGDEVAPGVLLGSRSLVTDQAENRLHLEKALMAVLVAEAPVAPPRLAEPVARRISASVRL